MIQSINQQDQFQTGFKIVVQKDIVYFNQLWDGACTHKLVDTIFFTLEGFRWFFLQKQEKTCEKALF